MVYPESEDAGKPKVFARQSFVVCGEEEEMAETILQARALGELVLTLQLVLLRRCAMGCSLVMVTRILDTNFRRAGAREV